jgi:hypothetical protein
MKRVLLPLLLFAALLLLALVVDTRFIGLRRRLVSPLANLPPAVANSLRSPQQMTLYSLDPNPFPEPLSGLAHFHGYRVLGETHLTSTESRRIVADTIRQAVAHWNGRIMACFNPRHAIRVSDGARTYDLVICFECQQIYSFAGDQQMGQTGLTGQQAALDEILKAADVPLPKAN